ncbi:DUF3108 domain-containing protein [Fulvivirgaceae bacterium BMA12]|uniref:DUF3108 domain-containing protein n=1 Tax=Agaribacillus aureus TaxID=3051825 RepID=A0ABT8L2J4_9BACT|nr:DUF3108 domain-containing protein [Fulvivirgaceae bacterium BMA12]
MRKLGFYFFGLLFLSSFILREGSVYEAAGNNSFTTGELLNFHVTFGIFSVGEAKMEIKDKTFNINGKKCYRVDVHGKTTGLVSWVAKVNDVWGAYVDTVAMTPQISYRKIRENNYKKDEIVKFDHNTNMIEYKVVDKKTGKFKDPLYYKAPENVRDMVGGYMYLRTMDLESFQIGDTITVDAFFEDTFYDFQIMYSGKETVKTKIGKIRCHKLVPVMPDNKLFDGENSITVWFSADQNKIPVRIEASMFIGKAGVEIEKTQGLLHPLNLVKKRNS